MVCCSSQKCTHHHKRLSPSPCYKCLFLTHYLIEPHALNPFPSRCRCAENLWPLLALIYEIRGISLMLELTAERTNWSIQFSHHKDLIHPHLKFIACISQWSPWPSTDGFFGLKDSYYMLNVSLAELLISLHVFPVAVAMLQFRVSNRPPKSSTCLTPINHHYCQQPTWHLAVAMTTPSLVGHRCLATNRLLACGPDMMWVGEGGYGQHWPGVGRAGQWPPILKFKTLALFFFSKQENKLR